MSIVVALLMVKPFQIIGFVLVCLRTFFFVLGLLLILHPIFYLQRLLTET